MVLQANFSISLFYNVLAMNFLILEERRATHVEVRIKFAFCPPRSPTSWNVRPGQCGPQRKLRMPGRSCPEWEPGHRVGHWSGNGQFHLIKHECGCFISRKKTHLRDGGPRGSSVGCLALWSWSPGSIVEGCRAPGLSPGSRPG